jgi:hypothetical protein
MLVWIGLRAFALLRRPANLARAKLLLVPTWLTSGTSSSCATRSPTTFIPSPPYQLCIARWPTTRILAFALLGLVYGLRGCATSSLPSHTHAHHLCFDSSVHQDFNSSQTEPLPNNYSIRHSRHSDAVRPCFLSISADSTVISFHNPYDRRSRPAAQHPLTK